MSIDRKKKAASTGPQSIDGTRSDVLRAAAKLFRNQGYAATTLRQIAEAVDVKAGSIYYHFDSKEQILDEVLDTGIRVVMNEVRTRLDALPAEAPCRRRIEAAIEGHLVGMLQHGDFTSANIRIYGQIPAGPKKRHRAVRAAYANYWDQLLAECQGKGGLRADVSVSVLRLFVVGALNWTVEWFDPRHGSLEAFIRQISAIVFDGISPHATASNLHRLRPDSREQRR